jgi:hypothetical protein
LFETLFQIAQRLKAMAFVLADPALVDLLLRCRIQIMQHFVSMPNPDGQVCRRERHKVSVQSDD